MSVNIVVACSEKSYVERLRRGLLNQEKLFKITQLYDRISCAKRLAQEIVDVLLIDDTLMANSELDLSNVKIVMVLVDEYTKLSQQQQEGVIFVKKYQRISKIARQISETLVDLPSLKVVQKNDSECQILSVYSPSGGSGTTLVALAQAIKFAKTRKTLYLSLEDISSVEYIFACHESKGLSEVFARLDFNTLDLLKLQDNKTKLYYYPSFRNLKDLTVIEKSEMGAFINLIKESGLYEIVVIDMSNNLSELNIELFNLSDELHVVINDQDISWYKFELLMKQAAFYRAIMEKGTVIVNRSTKQHKDLIPGIQISHYIEEFDFQKNSMLTNATFISSLI